MRDSLVERLRCPVDLSRLDLNAFHREADAHIMTGELRCTSCQRVYPIKDGVPDLVPSDALQVNNKNMNDLQSATVERFGFEWRYFRDWGWLTEYPDIPNAEEKFYGGLVEHTGAAFWSKSLFQKEDLFAGLLVLDAGCGNGRFTNEVAQTGAEVIGIDLGWGVYSAFEHTRALPNVHIIRGDLFRLPFANETFDRIFSIGVLMHTGNAHAAFDSLVRTLRPNGLILAHVYGKGIRTYEIADAVLRSITTRLPKKLQMYVARSLAAFARWLRGGQLRSKLYRRLFRYISLLPTEHHMYDWWSAPVATHHTLDEVLHWFSKNRLEILRTNPVGGDKAAELARRHGHGAITVLGRRA